MLCNPDIRIWAPTIVTKRPKIVWIVTRSLIFPGLIRKCNMKVAQVIRTQLRMTIYVLVTCRNDLLIKAQQAPSHEGPIIRGMAIGVTKGRDEEFEE